MASERVLVCGVSARAAAESAARAGFVVTALDAFADLDQHAAVRALSLPRDFGRPFGAAAAAAAARGLDCDAVVYLSPFENHPRSVDALARGRSLWGNPARVLARVRDPHDVRHALASRDLPALRVLTNADGRRPARAEWLVKPVRSGGGHGVRPWRGERVPRGCYLQERAAGTPGSLVFVAARGEIRPLALSRQLVGEPAFGAAPFRYCGTILARAPETLFERADALAGMAIAGARAFAEEFGLVGVNGVDFVASAGIPYVVEVNPRWTAAMELAERVTGESLFAAHASACVSNVLRGAVPPAAPDGQAHGKAIVFARDDVVVGDTAGWLSDGTVRDVPRRGERIAAGQPICTVFAAGRDAGECHTALAARARRVYEEVEEGP